MALDGVHFEAMTDLIGQVARPGRERDRHHLAERLWNDGLADPSSPIPIEPIDDAHRQAQPIDEVAVGQSPFDSVAAVDAGSLNPTTFQDGLVVDVAHAAIASTPSDIDLHRRRSIVAAVHGPPSEVRSDPDWSEFDHGYGRVRLLATPTLEQDEETAVHGLSLAAAEVAHALTYGVDHGDLLLMDGSVYPAGLLHWIDRGGQLAKSLHGDATARGVLQSVVDLVDDCRTAAVPIAGVVKNWTARSIVHAIANADELEEGTIPWPTDSSLFQQFLADISDERTDLRWTNWFAFEDHVATGLGFAIEEYGLDGEAPASAYDLAMMVVYDPRENLVFRIESPRVLIADADTREAITDHVLTGIAREGGPPPTLRKADELARIGRGERRQLKQAFERVLTSTEVMQYDELRWGE